MPHDREIHQGQTVFARNETDMRVVVDQEAPGQPMYTAKVRMSKPKDPADIVDPKLYPLEATDVASMTSEVWSRRRILDAFRGAIPTPTPSEMQIIANRLQRGARRKPRLIHFP